MSKKTERLYEALQASARQDYEKTSKEQAKIRAALMKALETLLGGMPERRAAELFADIEAVAPASAAKLIRRHDLRPEITDEIVAKRAKAEPHPQTPTA